MYLTTNGFGTVRRFTEPQNQPVGWFSRCFSASASSRTQIERFCDYNQQTNPATKAHASSTLKMRMVISP
jgi:hypothetical protein